MGNRSGKVHSVWDIMSFLMTSRVTSVEQCQYFAVNSEIKDVKILKDVKTDSNGAEVMTFAFQRDVSYCTV